MVSSGRWVCRRCFADNDGVATECASCGLGRWADVSQASAPAVPNAPADPGSDVPAWQPPVPPAQPFWKKLVPFWWVGLIAVFVVGGIIFNAKRDDSGAITDGGTLHVSELLVGDCFNTDTEQEVGDVDAVPCAEPHQYELFHIFTMTDPGRYPTEAEFIDQTATSCEPAFGTYVGLAWDDSSIYASSLEPTEDAWNDGDHSVQCILHEQDQSLVTGSLRGAAR